MAPVKTMNGIAPRATTARPHDAGSWRLAFAIARRELRGGIAGFRLFLVCLALGVAIIAAVGSTTSSAIGGLQRDAKALLGGDLEFRLLYRPADAAQREFLDRIGTVSLTRDMRAMARRPAAGEAGLPGVTGEAGIPGTGAIGTMEAGNGSDRTLVELKSVDGAYPLFGEAVLEPSMTLDAALALRDGRWGAVAEQALADRLELVVGDSIAVGNATYELRAILAREPDRGASVFILGPRLMVTDASLEATGLVAEGSLIGWNYRIALPEGAGTPDAATIVERARTEFPEAAWRIRGLNEAAPRLQRFIQRTSLYLTLVGLSTLLVGGVGIGNAVRAWLDEKIVTVATLKCLGAPAKLIFRTYLLLVSLMAVAGIAIGLAIGAVVPWAIAAPLGDSFALALEPAIYATPLLLAGACGFLVALAFSLWPLIRARQIPPGTLFRDLVQRMSVRPTRLDLVLLASFVALLVALAAETAGDRELTLYFAGGTIASFFLFHFAARGLKRLTQLLGENRPHGGAAHPTRFAKQRGPVARLALANIGRPGAPTTSALLSLGLGLTVLVMVALVQANLERELRGSLPDDAPSFYFIDIQDKQLVPFTDLVGSFAGVTRLATEPMLRGSIVEIDGVPAETFDPKGEGAWALRGDRGITWQAEAPEDLELVAGEWWPSDYDGPPLVSMESEVATGLGLEPGDTIAVNVLGRVIEAEVANLRIVDWERLDINFVMVFTPNALAGAPSMHIATAEMDASQEVALQRAVTDTFPNVSAIRVKDAIDAVARIMEGLGSAISLATAVTLAASLFVLAAAIAAQTHRRRYDAVVLKVLGATRRDIAKSFVIEYGLLGIAASILALLLGHIAAWALVTYLLEMGWGFDIGIALAVVVGGTVAAMLLGFLGTWRVLGTRPAPYLRNE